MVDALDEAVVVAEVAAVVEAVVEAAELVVVAAVVDSDVEATAESSIGRARAEPARAKKAMLIEARILMI